MDELLCSEYRILSSDYLLDVGNDPRKCFPLLGVCG